MDTIEGKITGKVSSPDNALFTIAQETHDSEGTEIVVTIHLVPEGRAAGNVWSVTPDGQTRRLITERVCSEEATGLIGLTNWADKKTRKANPFNPRTAIIVALTNLSGKAQQAAEDQFQNRH